MAGLCAPLSTLRQYPHGYLRMTRGRCGSLLLHRDGLAPSTPCRSPGALRSTPISRHFQSPRDILKGIWRDAEHELGKSPALTVFISVLGSRGWRKVRSAWAGSASSPETPPLH